VTAEPVPSRARPIATLGRSPAAYFYGMDLTAVYLSRRVEVAFPFGGPTKVRVANGSVSVAEAKRRGIGRRRIVRDVQSLTAAVQSVEGTVETL
jgi:hypothetical protein